MKLSHTSTDYEKVEWFKEIFACIKVVKERLGIYKWEDNSLLELFKECDGRDLIPKPDVVYQVKEHKTKPQVLAYHREWRARKKEFKAKALIEQQLEAKKLHALSRKQGLCYKCSKMVVIEEKSINIRTRGARFKPQMDLICKCTECGTKLCLWAGWYSI